MFFFFFTGCKKSDTPIEKTPAITINPSSLNIVKSYSLLYRLTVQVDGNVVQAADINWSSEDNNIATVNDKGYVMGKGSGETNINANLVNGKGWSNVGSRSMIKTLINSVCF